MKLNVYQKELSTAWKNAKMVINFNKWKKKEIKNFRLICLSPTVCDTRHEKY